MTFSTFVTPTRESETCSVGTRFWTSSRGQSHDTKASGTVKTGRMDQGFAKDKLTYRVLQSRNRRKRVPRIHDG